MQPAIRVRRRLQPEDRPVRVSARRRRSELRQMSTPLGSHQELRLRAVRHLHRRASRRHRPADRDDRAAHARLQRKLFNVDLKDSLEGP